MSGSLSNPDSAATATAPALAPSDRRRHARRKLHDELAPIGLGPDNLGLILDLAEGGLKVRSVAPLELGATTFLQFEAAQNTIEASGKIVWTDERRYAGIQFTALSELANSSIRQSLATDLTPHLPSPPLSRPDTNYSSSVAPSSNLRLHPVSFTESEVRVVLNHAASDRFWGGEARKRTIAEILQAARQSSGQDGPLQVIVERAASLTKAHGAAIALRRDGKMTCLATIGLAPEVGVVLEAESGLSAECLRLREIVWCNHALEDSRLDPEVCAQLTLGSAVILPVLAAGELLGILEVFAPEPNQFEIRHALLLRDIARLIARLATSTPDKAADKAVGKTEIFPIPPAPSSLAAPAVPTEAESVVAKTSAVSSVQSWPAGRIRPDFNFGVDPQPRPQHRTERRPFRRGRYGDLARGSFVVLAAAVILLSAWQLQRHYSASVASAPKAFLIKPAPRPAPLIGPPVASSPLPSPRVFGPFPVPLAAKNSAQPKPATAEPTTVYFPPPSAALSQIPSEPTPPVVVPSVSSDKTAIAVISDVLKPAPLSLPEAPLSAPDARPYISGGILARKVLPIYPTVARSLHLSGTVVLKLRINAKGKVDHVTTISGSALLVQAATIAVRQWRYTPYLVDGVPTSTDAVVSIRFNDSTAP